MKNSVIVILASFNGEKFIKEQIESILSQENVSIELFIFDDCSKDSTFHLINNTFNDSRIHIFRNNIQSGSAATNFLNSLRFILHSNTSYYNYISFADQDDIWLSKKLIEAINVIDNKNIDLYCSNLTIRNEQNLNSRGIIKKDFKQKKYDFLFEGASAGCTYVFKKDFAIKLIENFDNLNLNNWQNFSHDWYIYFFARINEYKVFIDSNSFIQYRIHQNNVHGQLNLNNLNSIKKRVKLVKSGWYFEHIINFKQLISFNSEINFIYDMYYKNFASRLYILCKYNFNLMRSNSKFLKFFLLSILIKPKKS